MLRSPGGFVFCFVDHPDSVRPQPATWADGSRSQVDQVCLDVPPDRYDAEVAFWQAVTGWELDAGGRVASSSACSHPPGSRCAG